MVYELVKYEQTATGLLLPNRPKELIGGWGEIIGSYYNPVRNPVALVLPRQSVDHIGLKLRFEDHEGRIVSNNCALLFQETSDLGHLVEVSGLGRDSDWLDLVGRNVCLHWGKEDSKLYGVTFDFSHDDRG